MSIVAPQGRKHLPADARLRLVRSGFDTIPDHRSDEAEIALTDALMSAFALFSLQSPSLLAFDTQRAIWHASTGLSVSLATGSGARYWSRSHLSLYARGSRAFFGNSSEVRPLNRWCSLMGTPCYPSMAPVIVPLRRFTARRVCPRSTETVAARITIRCWVRHCPSRRARSDSLDA